jgi:hypothetical protein
MLSSQQDTAAHHSAYLVTPDCKVLLWYELSMMMDGPNTAEPVLRGWLGFWAVL